VSAAARVLNVPRKRVRRSRLIAALPPAVKDEAVAQWLADNETALIAIADEPTAATQLARAQELGGRKQSRRETANLGATNPDRPQTSTYERLQAAWNVATGFRGAWAAAPSMTVGTLQSTYCS
jgi:hypothetical protein